MKWSKGNKTVTLTNEEFCALHKRWKDAGKDEANKAFQRKVLEMFGAFDIFQTIEEND